MCECASRSGIRTRETERSKGLSRCCIPIAVLALSFSRGQLGVAPIMRAPPGDRDAEEQDHQQQRDDYDYPYDHGGDYTLIGSRIET